MTSWLKWCDCVSRLSDATGKMVFSIMGEGNFSKSLLDPNDGKLFLVASATEMYYFLYTIVFIVDSGKEVFVWIGSGTTAAEKRNAMPYAHVRFDLLIYNTSLLFCCTCRTIWWSLLTLLFLSPAWLRERKWKNLMSGLTEMLHGD